VGAFGVPRWVSFWVWRKDFGQEEEEKEEVFVGKRSRDEKELYS